MKPTRNQLLAACGRPLDSTALEISDFLAETLHTSYPAERLVIFKELTSYSELHLYVTIKPRSEAEQSTALWDQLQVPIEPFTTATNCAIALAWCINESRACELKPQPGEANLLVQAVRAQLHINRFEVKHVVDKTAEPKTVVYRDQQGNVRERKEQPSKEVQFLDRGSVLLAFELAGLPAPKSYDDWRLPDGDNVPLLAISSDSSLGTMTVHYTNGELALVTSGDGMRAKVVHVKSLRSAAVETLRGLRGRAEGANHAGVREAKAQLTQDEAKALASKFCKRLASKEVAA